MSKPRRALVATGLAAAVVGALGVVSTLDASAGQTPGGARGAAAEPVPVPPERLPWGDRPSKIKLAKPGANSAAVAADGAAAADPGGAPDSVPESAPKGRSFKTNVLKREQATAPQSADTAGVAAASVYYHYALGSQTGDTDGTWAYLTVAKPTLAAADFHTLTEVAVQSADGQQIVEVGWTVDRQVNGDDDPHLFVYHWKDRKPGCYNGCGFVPYGTTAKPGDTLPTGAQKRFGIQHSGTVWWIAYNSEWIGYFPDSIWGGTYTKGGLTQWFGEVASASASPCTDMGNGLPASDLNAARVSGIMLTNGPVPNAAVRSTSKLYTVEVVDVNAPTVTAFRYGGPGAC